MSSNRTVIQFIFQCALLFTILSLPMTSSSQPSSTIGYGNLSTKAKLAFKSGNYHQALKYYQKIDRAFSSYTSQYNLAVCHYKLRNWQQAYRLFSKLHKQDPTNEVVQLNLALSANRMGNTKEALEHFALLADTAESDDIYALSYKHYRELLKSESENTEKNGIWMLNASLGIGSDDNIIDPADANASAKSDTFSELTLSASWYSSEDLNRAWLIDTMLYSSNYSEVSEYDVDIGGIAVKKYFPIGDDHSFYFGARLEQSRIDSISYLDSVYFDFGTRHIFNKSDSLRFLIRLQQSDNGNETYYGLAGDSYRISIDYQKHIGPQRWRFRYRFDQDDKNDSAVDIDIDGYINFTSYSADRHGLYGSWSYQSENWYSQIFISHRDSQYQDPHIIDSINILREDQRTSVGLQVSRQLSKHWSLDFELRNTNNQSSIDNYDYDQNIATIMLSWQNK